VDADACPVKQEICRVAKRHGMPVTFVSNSPMRIPIEKGIRQVCVEGGLDAADDWIAGNLAKDDIVITADIPLAGRSIRAGARVVAPDGRVFSEDNIGEVLATRDLLAGLRGAGIQTQGPPPFRKEDRSRFLHALDETLRDVRRCGQRRDRFGEDGTRPTERPGQDG